MLRVHGLVVAVVSIGQLVLATSCSLPPSATTDPDPPPAPGPATAQPAVDLTAVSLGVTIAARDDRGNPRLVRAVVPRPGLAGATPDQAARDHLAALTPLWMSRQRPAALMTRGGQRLRNGAQLVRFQQQVDGVDIHQGELRVMCYPDGSLVAIAGTVLPSTGRTRFRSTAVAALDRALDALYGTTRPHPAITVIGERAGFQELTVAVSAEVQVTGAHVKRELLPDGGRLRPIWTVELLAEIPGPGGPEHVARRYLIADDDGSVVRDVSLTHNDSFVYRVPADTTGNRQPLDGALQSYDPHPTGAPDGTLPDLGRDDLVAMEAFNGPHDPWLGATATTTTGNNVDAYADIARPAGFGPGDLRPEVRVGRTLNYRYDFTAEPLATQTQSKAAAVNLFYVTNWLHDWYYDSGFTEATGNAQADNFGRGGVPEDPLIARAQADALGGSRNSASMSTPSDGISPVMNMFLWTSLAGGIERDGDFDNAIIAHEWGHYLHLRLASCEGFAQCNAMSEGWGDFIALHLLLRADDDRDGAFPLSVYALADRAAITDGNDPGYFGIRRYPYSVDRTKDPLSFRHIGDDNPLPTDVPRSPRTIGLASSEVHAAGEVWATMLWDAYNAIIDEHGFTEAHRRMSDYVVAGLLLTPPDATYTEARDAILTAAGALDSDDMLVMAAAFAGRGAGTCAVSPALGASQLTGVVESGAVTARLETSDVSLTDDGVSCDHDGFLDPGESGTLHITVANSGILAAEDVVVRATTTSPGVTLGRPIRVGAVTAQSHVDLEIPVSLAATAPTDAALDIAIQVDGDAGCNTGRLVAALHQRMGIDRAPAASTSDDLESSFQAWTPAGDGAADLWSRVELADGNHALFGIDAPFTSDTQLVSPVLQVSPTAPLVVSLQHAYDLEAFPAFDFFLDGAVIELSSDGGATWRDVTELGVDPGYPVAISSDFDNPLAGRAAFSGTTSRFPALRPLVLDFGTQLAGRSVQLRFRIGSDFCCNASGWAIDNIAVSGITNKPFPGFVAEPSVCTLRASAVAESRVAQIRTAPHTRLGRVPGATDAP